MPSKPLHSKMGEESSLDVRDTWPTLPKIDSQVGETGLAVHTQRQQSGRE